MADYIVHRAVEHDALSAKVKKDLEQTYRWVLSPKYDGCHVVFCFEDGKHVATYSRTGETVLSMAPVADDLLLVYPDLLRSGRVAICGEAWTPGLEFNEISGRFRRQAPQFDLHIVPFDTVSWDYNDQPPRLGTSQRPPVHLSSTRKYAARANDLLTQAGGGYHRVILPRLLALSGTFSEVLPKAIEYAKEHKARKDNFFDGAVLAKAEGLYEVGAGKGGEFIKVKPLISFTVTVDAVVADVGSKTGKNTCVLLFELDGIIQKVSTGLTQEQADEYTANPNAILGKRIEVEAMGYTVNGYLREPRFKGIRDDA